jgi:uncharacterized membrane protein YphA (DoxX/SURF4 family)
MKIVLLIARLLMGLMFFVLGLNAFLNFIKAPLPQGLPGQFLGALFQSHYVYFVGAVQVTGGALLLINRYVPLALTLLGPVIVNILIYHLTMDPKGIGLGLVATLCWFLLFSHLRENFAGLFVARAS